MAHHDVLLEELQKSFRVRLLNRFKSDAFAPASLDKFLHVFVPDMHLISPERQKKYEYGFNSMEMFETLCGALVKTRDVLGNNRFFVTQMGDFLDLWRQGGAPRDAATTILKAFPFIENRFIRRLPESVGPNLLLGNHDLELTAHPDLIGQAKLSHFLRGWDTALLATHGDAFDWLEQWLDDALQSLALRTFIGRGADPNTYLQPRIMDAVLEFRAQDVNEAGEKLADALPSRIQGDATVKGVLDAAPAGMPDELNVLHVKSEDERDDAHTLLPNMVKTVHRYRTETLDGAAGPDAPDLKVVVIGHSHHARIVVDEPAGLLLVDTGAWIESFSAPGVPKTPNRQLGAICGGDFRVYQLDPKV